MPIIEVNHVTKEYRLGHMKSLKQSVLGAMDRLRGNPAPKQEPFKALDDVDFKVEEGEVLGIIGTNGAGKSTLLKLLARVSVPTKGGIKVRGSVAPLIEVGAGLHPELTGRENIFLNGSIMGLPRAVIKEKFDDIVEFAELEEFIDTPIKRYSSGMMIRLGFSIATSVDADILIIDEVLAVGDLAFQRKCFDRMENMIKGQGKTVLLVSHNIRQVERMCTRVILLGHGKILMDGSPGKVCESYYGRSNIKIAGQVAQNKHVGVHIRKSGEIELESLQMIGEDGRPTNEVIMGKPVIIRGVFNSKQKVDQSEIIYGFHTTDFFYISSMGTAHIENRPDLVVGTNTIECYISSLPLVPGVYCLRVSVLDKLRREMFNEEMLNIFTVKAQGIKVSKIPILGVVHIPVEWRFDL
jgi:ABC-type polysaccharide/polyol phosphate transport system ATPase subunit